MATISKTKLYELIRFPSYHERQVWERLWLCPTVEHQFVDLRKIVQIDQQDIDRRIQLIQWFIDSLCHQAGFLVEGSVFGSSVNGLGFKNSDIDLILKVDTNGTNVDKKRILKIIKSIGPRFLPARFTMINSKRCPIIKIECIDRKPTGGTFSFAKIDVSIAEGKMLTIHNSKCIRFFCQLEPKFHLLALVIRYWSKAQDLIVPGYMSSYALTCMLILFCQTLETPLLPTLDSMREKNKGERSFEYNGWDCSICMDLNLYKKSENQQMLSFLLLRFFEMYLNFNYACDYVNIRSGRFLSKAEFSQTQYYSKSFKFNDFLNIQDPFDLSHNLTGGMSKLYFERFLFILRRSYSTLHDQLISSPLRSDVARNWGLNSIFCKFTTDGRKKRRPKS